MNVLVHMCVCLQILYIKTTVMTGSQSSLCVQINGGDFLTDLCCYFSLSSYRLRITVLHCLLYCIAEMCWSDGLAGEVQSKWQILGETVMFTDSRAILCPQGVFLWIPAVIYPQGNEWLGERGLARRGQQISILTVCFVS